MPYGVKYDRKKKKFITYNKATGKVMGTHNTEQKAKDQQKALYANEDKEEK